MAANRVADMTVDELRALIRETVQDVLEEMRDEDPDAGLQLRPEVEAYLENYRAEKSQGRPAEEVTRELGLSDKKVGRTESEHLSYLTIYGRHYTGILMDSAKLLELEHSGDIELSNDEKRELLRILHETASKHCELIRWSLEERQKNKSESDLDSSGKKPRAVE